MPLVVVLVEHGEQPGYATVEAATDDGDPEGRDERRYEFDVPDEIDHHEEECERDGRADHEPDPESFAQLRRLGTVFGVSGFLVKVCVSHPLDIRQIRTPVGVGFTAD